MMKQAVRSTTHQRPVSRRVCPCTHSKRVKRHAVVTTALQSSPTKPAIAQFADSIGLPTDEGLFGFKPFSEVWCGRLAMMGFVSSFAMELQTGKGTLAQLGIDTPSVPLLSGISLLVVLATFGGAGYTAYLGFSGKMSATDAERYKKFLLLDKEDELVRNARAEGTIADRFLSVENDESPTSSSQAAPTVPAEVAETSNRAETAQVITYEDKMFNNYELKYARTVERDNGRAAMLGFLAAVLVEAATGKGIIFQLIMWFKAMGLLGYASGF